MWYILEFLKFLQEPSYTKDEIRERERTAILSTSLNTYQNPFNLFVHFPCIPIFTTRISVFPNRF
jgi:hypothetical protein